MKKLIVIFFFCAICFFGALPVFAESSGCYRESVSDDTAALYDLDDSLTENEEKALVPVLTDLVREMGFSVCVVISDNVGESKTDAQVIDYADLYLEEFCGINGDGILLLVNNDTKYDWISTSGRCINIFTDRKIDLIFDDFYGALKSGDYYNAVLGFCRSVERYSETDSFFESFGTFVGLAILTSPWLLLFPIFITVAFVSNVKKRYDLRPQKGAGNYLLSDSVNFSGENKDTFIRSYVRVESSTSRSHSSGGHHSSTHRSSSGGRHGGGGRRR